jgi:hypothetical protein
MRTAKGLTLDAIEIAQSNLLVAMETRQISPGTFYSVEEYLSRATTLLLEDQ